MGLNVERLERCSAEYFGLQHSTALRIYDRFCMFF